MDEPDANTSLLHELALRLTAYPGDPRVDDPQLLVGQLPPDLSVEIPLPEGSRVLGSLIRSQENIEIVLDSALSPNEVTQFYKDRMTAGGWNELENMRPTHGGFVHSGFPTFLNHAVYCKGNQGPAFAVDAHEGKNARTNVRIDLNGGEHSPCAQPNRTRHRMMHRDLQQLIPPLVAPKGASQIGGGGGGGGDSWHSTAMLEADADLPTLAVHYNEQLTKGGWTLSDEGQAGPLTWSTWTFKDEEQEPWFGLFFILKIPGKNRKYALELRIETDKKDDGGGMRLMRGGGGFSWAQLG